MRSQRGRLTAGVALSAVGATVIAVVLAQALRVAPGPSAASAPRRIAAVGAPLVAPTTTSVGATRPVPASAPKPALVPAAKAAPAAKPAPRRLPVPPTTLVPPPNADLLTPVAVPHGRARALVTIGAITIPAIGMHDVVREGIEQNVIDAGPAHWPGSAPLGGFGNAVIAGHRSTHTQPFHDIGRLHAGDRIEIRAGGVAYVYAVTDLQVVANTALWITRQAPGRTLTIFTCHPIGSSRQRLVVHATLVATTRAEA